MGVLVAGIVAPPANLQTATDAACVTVAMMSSGTLDEHIELTPDTAGGKPRIRGRRITVQNVAIWHERLDRSADEIAAE
jgi:hypothetical protein